jgi:hypothetical protein
VALDNVAFRALLDGAFYFEKDLSFRLGVFEVFLVVSKGVDFGFLWNCMSAAQL